MSHFIANTRAVLIPVVKNLARGLRSCGRAVRRPIGAMLNMHAPTQVIYNINTDSTVDQKRVAYVFLSHLHNHVEVLANEPHPNKEEHFLMLKVLTEMGYIVDVYNCTDSVAYNLKSNVNYDYILGFGPAYVYLCEHHPEARKILLQTENAPWVVRQRFAERVAYFKERHHRKVWSISRDNTFTDEMLDISDCALIMTGSYNMQAVREKLPRLEQYLVNVLPTKFPAVGKNHAETRTHFVWFGSQGFVHKGMDILIDAFAEMPELTLTVCGAKRSEIKDFKLPPNVIDAGFVSVKTEDYLERIVKKHTFTISLSCSEGMQSGIATCMQSGLIPVVTRETGYDDCEGAIQFEDWHIPAVKKTLRECAAMPVEELERLSAFCAEYAKSHYSAEAFKRIIAEGLTQLME